MHFPVGSDSSSGRQVCRTWLHQRYGGFLLGPQQEPYHGRQAGEAYEVGSILLDASRICTEFKSTWLKNETGASGDRGACCLLQAEKKRGEI